MAVYQKDALSNVPFVQLLTLYLFRTNKSIMYKNLLLLVSIASKIFEAREFRQLSIQVRAHHHRLAAYGSYEEKSEHDLSCFALNSASHLSYAKSSPKI